MRTPAENRTVKRANIGLGKKTREILTEGNIDKEKEQMQANMYAQLMPAALPAPNMGGDMNGSFDQPNGGFAPQSFGGDQQFGGGGFDQQNGVFTPQQPAGF